MLLKKSSYDIFLYSLIGRCQSLSPDTSWRKRPVAGRQSGVCAECAIHGLRKEVLPCYATFASSYLFIQVLDLKKLKNRLVRNGFVLRVSRRSHRCIMHTVVSFLICECGDAPRVRGPDGCLLHSPAAPAPGGVGLPEPGEGGGVLSLLPARLHPRQPGPRGLPGRGVAA